LSHLGIFDSSDSVGNTRSCCDGGNPGDAGEARHGICGKNTIDLVPEIDYGDAKLLRCNENGRYMTSDESENMIDTMRLQDFGDYFPSMRRRTFVRHAAKSDSNLLESKIGNAKARSDHA
jgi:hypothetical protein